MKIYKADRPLAFSKNQTQGEPWFSIRSLHRFALSSTQVIWFVFNISLQKNSMTSRQHGIMHEIQQDLKVFLRWYLALALFLFFAAYIVNTEMWELKFRRLSLKVCWGKICAALRGAVDCSERTSLTQSLTVSSLKLPDPLQLLSLLHLCFLSVTALTKQGALTVKGRALESVRSKFFLLITSLKTMASYQPLQYLRFLICKVKIMISTSCCQDYTHCYKLERCQSVSTHYAFCGRHVFGRHWGAFYLHICLLAWQLGGQEAGIHFCHWV